MDNMKEKLKNTKKNSKNKKIIILLVIILILSIIVNILSNKQKEENTSSKYESIRQIIEKYESTYIKEKKSEDKNYLIDIYANLKYDTFEDGESKQRFYENLIGSMANFVGENFRLIDEEKELIIEVVKNNISDNIFYTYLINGDNNYFSIEESKMLLNSIEGKDNTNFEINSSVLNQLIQNEWKKEEIHFGSKESTFDGYDIYFDEGIKARIISNRIYNIVFTPKYNNAVMNGIMPGTDFEQIILKFGEPTYGSKEDRHIGYKNNDLYVIFTKDEISIFRNETVDMTEFELLLEKYINKEIEIKKFMNELTYLWDDYDEYRYDENSIYINYALKGIKIEMDYDNSLGIKIYNNCTITPKISDLIEAGKITGCLNENLIYNEVGNINEAIEQYIYLSNLSISENPNRLDSILYNVYISNENIFFISKNDENPNKELKKKITDGFFITDNLYLYSCKEEGIYLYNVLTNEEYSLVKGNEEFKLINYENQILKYDDKEIKINME